ncbi:TetR/AcrR family transcriptional regulator [Nocardia sp. NPDC051756]|uniref:TetR/AcrR family transcriptional regulator n=1 Tax=Nocardia sp. NPDC051756 TaxID=3154751 RepID=UPI00344A5E7A
MNSARVDGRTLRHQHRQPELLAAATEYTLEHGISDVSLRTIAQGIGVTHATLLRHFSSKEELLRQVVDRIHTDFLAQLDGSAETRCATSISEYATAVWRYLCEPREQRQFVLLFEVVARAARDPDGSGRLAPSIIDDWLSSTADHLIRYGCPPSQAPELATLLLAQVRGLQLDLVTTGDRARADRAFEHTVALLATFGKPA